MRLTNGNSTDNVTSIITHIRTEWPTVIVRTVSSFPYLLPLGPSTLSTNTWSESVEGSGTCGLLSTCPDLKNIRSVSIGFMV